MPLLLRQLPGANNLGTVHTPRMTSAALLTGMPSSSETACRVPPVEGPAVDRVTKIFNGAIEDAALDKRDGAQRAVAGRMAGPVR